MMVNENEKIDIRNILKNLENIIAEQGEDAVTNEVIEECCKSNNVEPHACLIKSVI